MIASEEQLDYFESLEDLKVHITRISHQSHHSFEEKLYESLKGQIGVGHEADCFQNISILDVMRGSSEIFADHLETIETISELGCIDLSISLSNYLNEQRNREIQEKEHYKMELENLWSQKGDIQNDVLFFKGLLSAAENKIQLFQNQQFEKNNLQRLNENGQCQRENYSSHPQNSTNKQIEIYGQTQRQSQISESESQPILKLQKQLQNLQKLNSTLKLNQQQSKADLETLLIQAKNLKVQNNSLKSEIIVLKNELGNLSQAYQTQVRKTIEQQTTEQSLETVDMEKIDLQHLRKQSSQVSFLGSCRSKHTDEEAQISKYHNRCLNQDLQMENKLSEAMLSILSSSGRQDEHLEIVDIYGQTCLINKISVHSHYHEMFKPPKQTAIFRTTSMNSFYANSSKNLFANNRVPHQQNLQQRKPFMKGQNLGSAQKQLGRIVSSQSHTTISTKSVGVNTSNEYQQNENQDPDSKHCCDSDSGKSFLNQNKAAHWFSGFISFLTPSDQQNSQGPRSQILRSSQTQPHHTCQKVKRRERKRRNKQLRQRQNQQLSKQNPTLLSTLRSYVFNKS